MERVRERLISLGVNRYSLILSHLVAEATANKTVFDHSLEDVQGICKPLVSLIYLAGSLASGAGVAWTANIPKLANALVQLFADGKGEVAAPGLGNNTGAGSVQGLGVATEMVMLADPDLKDAPVTTDLAAWCVQLQQVLKVGHHIGLHSCTQGSL